MEIFLKLNFRIVIEIVNFLVLIVDNLSDFRLFFIDLCFELFHNLR